MQPERVGLQPERVGLQPGRVGLLLVDLAQVLSVDRDGATLHVVEAIEQPQHGRLAWLGLGLGLGLGSGVGVGVGVGVGLGCRLARARAAHDGKCLAGLDHEAHAAQQLLAL